METKPILRLEPGTDPTIFIESALPAYRLLYKKIEEAIAIAQETKDNPDSTSAANLICKIKTEILCVLSSQGYFGKSTFQKKISTWPNFNADTYEKAFFELMDELNVDM